MTVTVDLAALSADVHARRTLSDISLSIAKGKRIVVVTGAGISCSCGIPDFRSSDGLYALVKQQYPDVVLKGRDLFDASLFRDPTSTAVFYTFISQLKRSIDDATPSPTHHFIKTLDSKKKLLRSYTQNIDGLEARVGLLGSSCHSAKSTGKSKNKLRTKDVRNVQLHGDIHRVRCVACSAEFPCTEEHLKMFNAGAPPDCPECVLRSDARIARSARPIRVGSLRPAIVLYDEPHPLGDDIAAIQTADLSRKPDLLIIMGTSLKVHGLKKLVKEFAKTAKASASPASAKKACKVIFVNKTAPSSEWGEYIDYHVAGETDVWVGRVIEDWKKMRPMDWEVQQTLVTADGDVSMNGAFKTVKANEPTATKQRKKGSKRPEGMENAPPVVADAWQGADASMVSIVSSDPLQPPLSPGKRRQGASHYNTESSPSKRRTVVPQKNAMPTAERKLLFAERTNNEARSEAPVLAAVDSSIVDLSMQDIEVKSNNPVPRRTNGKRNLAKVQPAKKETVRKVSTLRSQKKVVVKGATSR